MWGDDTKQEQNGIESPLSLTSQMIFQWNFVLVECSGTFWWRQTLNFRSRMVICALKYSIESF